MRRSFPSIPLRLIVTLAFATLILGQTNMTSYSDSNSNPVTGCVKTDAQMSNTFGSTATVKVQPNCDAAIDAVCGQVPLGFVNKPAYATYKATAGSNDIHPGTKDAPEACEVHLVGVGSADLLRLSYTTCVQGFQNITVNCMLLNYGAQAQKGKQAGVRGVTIAYPPAPNATSPQPGSSDYVPPTDVAIGKIPLLAPGFLAGPPGYFGDVNLEASLAKALNVQAAPIVVPLKPNAVQPSR
ncbi:MAG: hypothetical protein Q9168_004611 [Polycauliona sp. 1 TL-2023]